MILPLRIERKKNKYWSFKREKVLKKKTNITTP